MPELCKAPLKSSKTFCIVFFFASGSQDVEQRGLGVTAGVTAGTD